MLSLNQVHVGEVTLSKDRKNWVITCEPHIRSRLKRVFPKVSQHAGDKVRLSITPENSYELMWFMQRYPFKMEESVSRLMEREQDSFVETQNEWESLLQGALNPQPVDLAIPARHYQLEVPQMMGIQKKFLLGDELGLGKTISAICCMVPVEHRPVVVVYPAYMLDHWVNKIEAFAPDLRVHQVKKSTYYDLVAPAGKKKGPNGVTDRAPDVIAVTYHKLRGWADHLKKIAKTVIFDECQHLRHPGSLIYSAASQVASGSTYCMGLSATPIYNYGAEFYHVINAIRPMALGSYEEFYREWCEQGYNQDKARIKDTQAFGQYLRKSGIMVRRTRKEVGREMPLIQREPIHINANPEIVDKGKSAAMEMAKIILDRNTRAQDKFEASGKFEQIMRQQTGIAKAPYVAEFVRMIVESGEKVVVFGWHHAVYDIWKEMLGDLGVVSYTGEQTEAQKIASKHAFIHGDAKVMLMSLRSGAGVDELQHACSVIVFGELDWSPGAMQQCEGRVDRDGQTEQTIAYYLYSSYGSDPAMQEVLGIKKNQVEGVMNLSSSMGIQEVTNQKAKLLAQWYLERHDPEWLNQETERPEA